MANICELLAKKTNKAYLFKEETDEYIVADVKASEKMQNEGTNTMNEEVDKIIVDNKGTKPCFISSSPTGEDLFEGKSQEQIAESVSQLISHQRTESNLIGLDGAWGSGKSNLVKIIELKLKSTHHVFIYDAWGHQEDLQRRAFLEELTANLCDKEIVDSEVWTKKLKNLLSRKRETVTKTVPRLSYGVVVTVLIALFTPIAGTIAEGIEDQFLKVLITSLPLLIGLLIWIIASIRVKHFLSLPEIYALYKENDLINETHVAISEKEPSVREFQGWMKKLSNALCDKKLIIVFDNMDRLPPDRVRELWSSIHTFFAEESFNGIWVIIPFDRKHIAAAFQDDLDMSDEFLNKSFSVMYRVAPPVLTDWQKFFELKYNDAFKNGEEKELHIVRRTFDLLQPEISPRKIIAFINEMVSLRLVVESSIQLRYIAVFVLAKREILESPVDQILNLEFLGNAASLFSEDKDLPNYIAALVYHVPLASASQVTLTREIQNAINDRNGKRFNQLAKHQYFMDILEQVIVENGLQIPYAATTLALLDDEHKKGKEVAERYTKIWDRLSKSELRTTHSDQDFTTTHKLLLENISPPRRLDLVKHIVTSVRNSEKFNGGNYYKALSNLNYFLQEEKLEVDMISMLTDIKTTPHDFISYMQSAGEDYKTFRLQCDESKLIQTITERIPDNLAGLSAVSAAAKDYNFKPIIELLEKELQKNTITAENITSFFEFYRSIAKEKPIHIIGDKQINSLLSTAKDGSEEQLDLWAMRLSRMSGFPNFGGISESLLAETDEAKASRISQRIEFYTTYGDLLLGFVSWQKPLLKVVLRDLTLNPNEFTSLNISSVLKEFNTLYTSLDITPSDFIGTLNTWASDAEAQINAENITNIVENHEFFEYAVEIENDLTNHINKTMIEYINSLDVEEWSESLRDTDSYLFNVSYYLLQSSILKSLPADALIAYKEILIDTAKGKFSMDPDQGWGVFYETTNKNKLKSTGKNIRDLFISDIAITTVNFIALSNLLFDHAALNERSGDVARKILAPVADNEECLNLIVENGKSIFSVVEKAGDDADDFKDIIRQKVTLPDVSVEVIDFARTIGIDVDDNFKDK